MAKTSFYPTEQPVYETVTTPVPTAPDDGTDSAAKSSFYENSGELYEELESSDTTLAQMRVETAASAASAAAALVSENNAETAEANAETAETNAETALAAALLAKAAAELAEAHAETSETNAETAETNAETAQGLAQAAQAAAEAAQAAAEAAQAAAETAETNAETAETNAETAEANAETAETNAETARDAALAAQAAAEAAAASIGNLDSLTDVVISGTPADNEVVAWDTSTSRFINQTAAEAGLATEAYATAAASAAASAAAAAIVDSSPGTLDTLNELAAALGDDPNFATTIATALSGKQPLDTQLTDIAALAVTDGNFIVGNGTTFVVESFATARNSLSLGTSNSPEFTAINLGHASNTTIGRVGAGDISIEGNLLYRAGGTDVPVADGGTGASDAPTAFSNLKQAATESATGVVELATIGESQNGTDTSRAVTSAGLRSATREKLLANRTYYVRTDGSNSNTGLVDSAGGALLTIQHAVNTIATLDLNGFNVVVQARDGTYTAGAPTLKAPAGFSAAGQLTIQGNSGTPGNCIVSVTSAQAFSANGVPCVWDIKDMEIRTTTGGNCIIAENGSTIRFGNIRFGACADSHLRSQSGSTIQSISAYSVVGGAVFHYCASTSGKIIVGGITVTVTGTPAFTIFALAELLSVVYAAGNTYSGAATGTRYTVIINGVIHTNGGGANFFPGNVGGSAATGGQYI